MSVPGNDLLSQIENENPKLGIYIRNYLIPTLQPKGLAGYVLATPPNQPGTTSLQPISSITASVNPKSATYVGTSATGDIIEAESPTSGITELTGDVVAGPGSGSESATVEGVNGAAIPVSETYVGTNASGQFISAPTPPASPNFADNETVTITGGAGTLAHTPNPAASLQLFGWISGFGAVLLIQGVDYTLSGANIAILSGAPPSIGAYYAFYRY